MHVDARTLRITCAYIRGLLDRIVARALLPATASATVNVPTTATATVTDTYTAPRSELDSAMGCAQGLGWHTMVLP